MIGALASIGSVLRNEQLRRVELAWGASVAAEWANFVALGVFAYDIGGTLGVGVAGLVRLLPAALVAPFAALVGDRFRRERFLVAISVGGLSHWPARQRPTSSIATSTSSSRSRAFSASRRRSCVRRCRRSCRRWRERPRS
jgi:hypothetical protein